MEVRGTVLTVTEGMEGLERRIEALRAEVRRAVMSGDRQRAQALRAELRAADAAWEEALAGLAGLAGDAGRGDAPGEAGPAGSGAGTGAGTGRGGKGGRGGQAGALLPVREQVHQALTLLGAPAAPRLIAAVHEAFYPGGLAAARLTSLRRDEERSFRAAPQARPYYLCAALTAELLAPARGLLAVSTWPMERRVIGPLSLRVDYLTAAIGVARRLRDMTDPSPAARRLLWRFAVNIPEAAAGLATMSPGQVAGAAKAELAIHSRADAEHRAAAARRAKDQLDQAEQLFGAGLRTSDQMSSGA